MLTVTVLPNARENSGMWLFFISSEPAWSPLVTIFFLPFCFVHNTVVESRKYSYVVTHISEVILRDALWLL
jgi:hypothetical protein